MKMNSHHKKAADHMKKAMHHAEKAKHHMEKSEMAEMKKMPPKKMTKKK